jgi:hypothetical protein
LLNLSHAFILFGMATYTAQQLLTLADQAIADILGGAQSAMVGTRQFSKASLSTLRELRRELQQEVARTSGNRPIVTRADFNYGSYE